MASIPSGADHRPVACGQSVDDVKANERVRRQLGHGPEYVQVGGHPSGSRTRSRGPLSPTTPPPGPRSPPPAPKPPAGSPPDTLAAASRPRADGPALPAGPGWALWPVYKYSDPMAAQRPRASAATQRSIERSSDALSTAANKHMEAHYDWY